MVSSFLGASIFVIAICLSGVMGDFKECEKIPAELETCFQFLLTHLQYAVADSESKATPYRPMDNPAHNATSILHMMLTLIAQFLDKAEVLADGKKREMDYDTAINIFRRLDARFQAELMRYEARYLFPPVVVNMSTIRAKLSRIHVLRETSFILAGYSLFDVIVAFAFLMLVTTQYKGYSGIIVCGFFTFLFLYMSNLIRALDDPFNYKKGAIQGLLRTGEPILQDWCEVDFSVLFSNFASQLQPFLPPEYVKKLSSYDKDDPGVDISAMVGAIESKDLEAASAKKAAEAKRAAEAQEKAAAAEKREREQGAIGGGRDPQQQQPPAFLGNSPHPSLPYGSSFLHSPPQQQQHAAFASAEVVSKDHDAGLGGGFGLQYGGVHSQRIVTRREINVRPSTRDPNSELL